MDDELVGIADVLAGVLVSAVGVRLDPQPTMQGSYEMALKKAKGAAFTMPVRLTVVTRAIGRGQTTFVISL